MLDFLRASSDTMLADLRWLVEHESPSGDKRPLDALVDRIAAWATDLTGLRATTIPSPAGNHLRLESGTASDGKRPLLLFHFDTVWPIGTLDQMPFCVGRGRARGPGVFDMKAGIVQGVWALHALRSLCGYMPPLVCLLTSDEETGSLTSRELIESVAATASATLVLEPSQGGLSRSRSRIRGSRRLASVLVKHSTQAITALHWPALRDGDRFTFPRRTLLQPLVRPGLLVVLDELPQHVLQMAAPEDQQMVQDLAPGCPYPSLRE